MNHYPPTRSTMRRLGLVTFAGAVACAGGLVTMLGLGGQANALDNTPAKYEPVVPDDLDLSDLTEPTLPEVPTLDVPIATLPQGPDGPVFDGPINFSRRALRSSRGWRSIGSPSRWIRSKAK